MVVPTQSVLRHDHEPDALVFGPVNSRRFGRSFGISLSYPGQRACQWNCPYCQLGHLPNSKEQAGSVWTSVEELRAVLAAADPGDADVVCCSGSGENLDHPDFINCLALMSAFARRHAKPRYVLTNGDALLRKPVVAALAAADLCMYVKWDCGARDGMWRRMTSQQRSARWALLRSLPQIKIQAMFVRQAADNDDLMEQHILRWLDEMSSLRPMEILLTTIDRPCADTRCEPLSRQALMQVRQRMRQRLAIPVKVFAHGE